MDTAGSAMVFESDCDLTGDNEDGNREIFFAEFNRSRIEIDQLTQSAACTNSNPTLSGDGSRVAFESDCNLDASNAEGNVEIFTIGDGAPRAVTDTFGCSNLAPTLNGDGSKLVYDSDCGSILDLSSEVFLATLAPPAIDVITQLTNDTTGECDNLEPDIDDTGSLVIFESDCDLVGQNEDFAPVLYSVVPGGPIAQLLAPLDDTCSSLEARVSGDGATAVFTSDCDFVGTNGDRGTEIFQVRTLDRVVSQITTNAGGNDCEVGTPETSEDGSLVIYTSSCKPNGNNADGNFEIFRGGVSKTAEPITTSTGCNSFAPVFDGSGSRLAFDSDCDLVGDNDDGGSELFHLVQCRCGAPATRGSKPLAADAFFILRAAVGLVQCSLCECDVDGNGAIRASDALRDLQAAVGLAVPLLCPDP